MESRHKCKLCSRRFGSGRALGGHMKAHLATLPLPPKLLPLTQSSHHPFSYSSSSQQLENEEEGLIYELRENPKKSLKIADPKFSFAIDNTNTTACVQDRESETESKNPTRKRSKRNRKSSLNHQNLMEHKKQCFTVVSTPEQPVSSVSDTSPEEDVAMCLMMLSRDKWRRRSSNVAKEEESKGCNQEIKIKRIRGKHVCENCGKAFRSSKALGSHTSVCYDDDAKEGNNKIFECPYCVKVFGSGQALGGHKRSHLIPSSSNSIANANTSSSFSRRILKDSFIDLNLPAQPEEDDDLSVLSDA